MKSFVSRYNSYLRRISEVAPARARSRASYRAMFPWAAAIFLAALGSELLNLQSPLTHIVVLPVAVICGIGGTYAALKVAHYSWRFERTPVDAPWTETAAGRHLIRTLQRVTLNGLRETTLDARLQKDLGLTDSDLRSLIDLLVKDGQLDSSWLDRPMRNTTVRMVLKGMSQVARPPAEQVR